MKRNRTGSAKAYTFIAFRPSPLLDKRLRKLSERSGQGLSALVSECVAAHLPILEMASKEAA